MVSNYLKEYFNKNNITQLEIERRTKIRQSKISLSLSGKRNFTADELIVIAIKFEINLENIKKDIKLNHLR